MANFWCWLFGHRWKNMSEWVIANTDVDYPIYCGRCGTTAAKLFRKEKVEE